MYKYTDNDVSLTLISPMLESSPLAPQTEVEPSYVNTRLTNQCIFLKKKMKMIGDVTTN